MRKALGLLLALALMTTACGGSGGTDPAAADSCDALVDVGMNVLQDALDSIAGISLDELMEMTEQPEAFEKLETLDFDGRAEELGCSDAEVETLSCSKVGQLKADGEAAQFMLESFTSGC